MADDEVLDEEPLVIDRAWLDPDKLSELEKVLYEHSRPVSVREKSPFLKSLIYGHKKVGKTVLTCKVTPRPLLLAADAGWVSLKDWPELSHVEVIEYRGLKHLELLTKAFKEDLPLYREFDHLIFDPVSTAVYDYLSFLQENFSPSMADTRVTYIPKAGSKEKAFTTTGMNDYNALLQQFRGPVYKLGLIQKDITYVCHVKDAPVTNLKDKSIKPNLPQGIASLLSKEVGVIGFMEDTGKQRTISLKATDDVEAGSWIRALHGKTVNAEQYPEIIRKWKAGTL